MWMQYPEIEALFSVDDQYMIGADILVKPVTAPGVEVSVVKFPTDDIWYDAETLALVSGKGKAKSFVEKTVPSDIDTIPVFQRGGSVITRKLRLRRSSHLMTKDPYTLYVALSVEQKASGVLYMDDEVTFDHISQNAHAESTFEADFSKAMGSIKNTVEIGPGWVDSVHNLAKDRTVERLVIMGVQKSPKSVKVDDQSIDFTFDSNSKILVIRKPSVSALTEWEVKVTY